MWQFKDGRVTIVQLVEEKIDYEDDDEEEVRAPHPSRSPSPPEEERGTPFVREE
jgi:hypothetical protein